MTVVIDGDGVDSVEWCDHHTHMMGEGGGRERERSGMVMFRRCHHFRHHCHDLCPPPPPPSPQGIRAQATRKNPANRMMVNAYMHI